MACYSRAMARPWPPGKARAKEGREAAPRGKNFAALLDPVIYFTGGLAESWLLSGAPCPSAIDRARIFLLLLRELGAPHSEDNGLQGMSGQRGIRPAVRGSYADLRW
jgi:hypothetical protein